MGGARLHGESGARVEIRPFAGIEGTLVRRDDGRVVGVLRAESRGVREH